MTLSALRYAGRPGRRSENDFESGNFGRSPNDVMVELDRFLIAAKPSSVYPSVPTKRSLFAI
jgi:hypothetical protein